MKNENDEAKTPANPRLRFGLGGALIALCLAMLAAQTWRRWGDLAVDFGAQLYLPWKLSSGAVLYRDVAYLTGGPLSQYYHAWLFRLFGVSVLTIVVSNLAILVLLAALIYWSFYRMSDVWTATVAGLALVLVFAFGQYGSDGTFNYLSPYSHELVHGLVLSVLVLGLLARWVVEEKIALALLAGIGSGLVLLTKPEIFLALAVAQAAALILFWRGKYKPALLASSALGASSHLDDSHTSLSSTHLWRRGPGRGGSPLPNPLPADAGRGNKETLLSAILPKSSLGRSALAILVGTLLAPAAFFLYFVQHESVAQSIRSVLWAWAAVMTHAAPDNSFYHWCLGLDTPGYHLKMILRETAELAGFLAGYAALSRIRATQWPGKLAWLLAVGAGGYLALDFNWLKCGYALPGLCVASLAQMLWQARKPGLGSIQPFPLLWSVFSLMLLAKLGLFPRVWHYGFVLAMPAFLNAVYLLLWQIPSLLEKPGGTAGNFRVAVSLALFIGMVQLWQDSQGSYSQRAVLVGTGADQMLCKPSKGCADTTLGRVAGWLQANTPAHSTLAALPDGVMLNYLLRRDNPTGYLRWNQTESTVFGEDTMTQSFMRMQPDYIVLIQVSIEETRIKSFGQDPHYGGKLTPWIQAHYKAVYQTGPPAVTVYERIAPAVVGGKRMQAGSNRINIGTNLSPPEMRRN